MKNVKQIEYQPKQVDLEGERTVSLEFIYMVADSRSYAAHYVSSQMLSPSAPWV